MTEWTADPHAVLVDFNRDSNGPDDPFVWATVYLPFDISITVRSDEPSSPREWLVEEITLILAPEDALGVARSTTREVPFTVQGARREPKVGYGCDLGKFLAREWDRYVAREQHLPYAAGAR